MTGKKLYLILQSVLCVLLVIFTAVSAVSIYREGAALKAEDPLASIYTREKTAEKLRPIAPLFFGALGMTVVGWVLEVKDENAEKPVKDAGLVRNLTVSHRKAKRVLQVIVAIAAVVFIVLGVMNGSAKAVHTKAANICTECVGLG